MWKPLLLERTPASSNHGRTLRVVSLLLLAGVAHCRIFDPVNPSSPLDTQAVVNEDAFRAIISAAYRVQTSTTKSWCYAKPQKELSAGRPYQPRDFGSYVVTLMSLLTGLNMLSQSQACSQIHTNFLTEVNTTLTTSTVPTVGWWEDKFLPLAASAFTCGRNIPSNLCTTVLPSDVTSSTCNTNLLVRQVWFLLKSYIISPLKQRERSAKGAPPRRTDYDLSMYVPFIGKHLTVQGRASPYQSESLLRVGFPFYIGPSLWRTFHTVAMRMVDYSSCIESQGELIKAFKKMLLYFAVAGQPCPYCREHFLSSVSRNDIQYDTVCKRQKTLDGADKYAFETTQCSRPAAKSDSKLKSEANIYPIEWVTLGCSNVCQTSVTEIMKSKFDAIRNVTNLNLFLWKLHNAVTATVKDGKFCSVEERYDDALFNCTPNNFDEKELRGRPLSRRYWPFSKRYEFSLLPGSSSSNMWKTVRSDQGIRSAVNNLLSATDMTVKLRVAVTSGSPGNSDDIQNINRLVADLDRAMWNSQILQKVYSTTNLPAKGSCTDLKTRLNQQSTIPLPNIDTIDTICSFTQCSPAGHANTGSIVFMLTVATFLHLVFI